MHPCLSLFVAVLSVVVVFSNVPPRRLDSSSAWVKLENVEVGTVLGTLAAVDFDGPEPISYTIESEDTRSLVSLSVPEGSSDDSIAGRHVNVSLISPLDRDYEAQSRRLAFSMHDGFNSIKININLYISDINDNEPAFRNLPYKTTVPENQPVNSTIYSNITTFDPDNGPGGSVTYSMQAADDHYMNTFAIDKLTGVITLRQELDYELHSFYQFEIIATDGGGLNSSVDFMVTILDIQDTAPYFMTMPYKVIREDVGVGFSILQVTALDGDRGVPNTIVYEIVGVESNYEIDPDSGWLTVKIELDRDSVAMKSTTGVNELTIKASEVNDQHPQFGISTATTKVTIMVEDVNDNKPLFNYQSITARMMENMPKTTPITFDNILQVSDNDQAEFSRFSFRIEKDGQLYDKFVVVPSEGIAMSSVMIRKNTDDLFDYETTQQIDFQVIAQEMLTAELYFSICNVTLNVEDMNDNWPEFGQEEYNATVPENASYGDFIIQITAVDLDSGQFGEMLYSLRGSDRFDVDMVTGKVFLNQPVDREKRDVYYLMFIATDGGNIRTSVPLTINVGDINDEKPYFRRLQYDGVIREGEDRFSRPLIMEAMDDDQENTPNSAVEFLLVGGTDGLQGKFAIDSQSGEIEILSPLDYEALHPALNGRVLLEIVGHDLGDPQQSSTITVEIIVVDINDKTPQFDPVFYSHTIPESATPGTNITTVSAVDLDGTKPNNDFVYRIESGAGDKFRIDANDGTVSVEKGALLDVETTAVYNLTISAIDRGTPPLNSECLVMISLRDVNDEVPVFKNTRTELRIPENTTEGSSILMYTATDQDTDSRLFYYIVHGDIVAYDDRSRLIIDQNDMMKIRWYFVIDPDTGNITVNSTLDRETASQIQLPIQVNDLNAWRPDPQIAMALLLVTLEDSNDNPPEFLPSNAYEIDVSEGLPGGSQVANLRLELIDPDQDQTVSLRIGSDPSGSFELREKDKIFLRKRLDRETDDMLTFTIIAVDNGTPQLSATAQVTVNVIDVNDNSAVFDAHNSEYSVPENSVRGFSVTTLTAQDPDLGDFGDVFYSIETGHDGKFSIEQSAGKLSVAGPLDRETKSSYTIVVVATDNFNDPQNQKSNRTIIQINIIDVNDNYPQFKVQDASPRQIHETQQVQSNVFTVVATDDDIGLNAELEFSLGTDTNATGLFAINQRSGVITVKSSLIGHVGVKYLTVNVKDKGAEPLTNSTRVWIEILDVNLHQPIITYPVGPLATLRVLEGIPLSIQITAEDQDFGKNGEVNFELVQDTRGDWSKFDLDTTTGLLTNNVVLDREEKAILQIQIRAYDLGAPPQSSSLTLTLQLLDVNDYPPSFNRQKYPPPYRLHVLEEQDSSYVGSVDIAEDLDSGNNSQVCYELIGGAHTDKFRLERTTGALYAIAKLDREAVGVVDLLIKATDCAQLVNRKRRDVAPPAFNSTDPTMLWVQVIVDDINDSPPVFKRHDLNVGITRDTQYGTTIYNLKDEVVDADIGNNSIPSFYLLKAIEFSVELQNQIDRLNNAFLLFRNGTIRTNVYFQNDMYGYIIIPLLVNDSSGYNSTAELTIITLSAIMLIYGTQVAYEERPLGVAFQIFLINDEQRVKVIFRRTPEEVRAFKDVFISRLENITGFRIVVDKIIQTHQNAAGKPEPDKTDMLIHAVDRKTNKIVDADDLLKAIDYNTAKLIDIFNDYNIIEVVPTNTPAVYAGSEKELKVAIILLSIFLGLMLIILAATFYTSRRKYRRKLRAASALHFVSNSNSDLHKSDMPGTNVHSYENANPIYLEKAMLNEIDYNSQNSLDENTLSANPSPSIYDEQEICMDLYPDDMDAYNKLTASKLGSSDEILLAALQEHEASKNLVNPDSPTKTMNDKQNIPNGVDNKAFNVQSLQTTEI